MTDLGCPLLRGSSARRLRRYAATGTLIWLHSEKIARNFGSTGITQLYVRAHIDETATEGEITSVVKTATYFTASEQQQKIANQKQPFFTNTGRMNVFGGKISRAVKMEPKTKCLQKRFRRQG